MDEFLVPLGIISFLNAFIIQNHLQLFSANNSSTEACGVCVSSLLT